jgi:PAS domain S-box-containing protein
MNESQWSSYTELRDILDTFGEASVFTDATGQILLWNNAAERLLGYTSLEALGKQLSILLPEMAGIAVTDQTFQMNLGAKWGKPLVVKVSVVTIISAHGPITVYHFVYKNLEEFATATLDALSANVCVLDTHGTIVTVNRTWREFAAANQCAPDAVSEGTNYLAICETAAGPHSEEALPFATGIRSVIAGECAFFSLEYPCHSPAMKRWFTGSVTPLVNGPRGWVVIAHENITQRKLAEEALRESEAQNSFLANLLSSSDQPFAVGYLDGGIGYFNTACERVIGYSRDELTVMDWRALTPPEWHAMEAEKMEELLRTGMPVRYEKEFFHKNGTRIPMEVLVHLKRFNDGTPDSYYAFFTDLTAQKQVEAALRSSEERLQALINQSPIGIVIGDLAGNILETNPAYEKMLGYTAEELKGKFFAELTYPDDVQAQLHYMAKTRAGENNPFEMDKRYICKDGRIIWSHFVGVPFLDDKGHVTMGLALINDITERKLSQDALYESEERFRALTENSLAGIYVIQAGRFTYVNPALAAMLRYDRDELVGASFLFPIHPEDQSFVTQNVNNRLAGEPMLAGLTRLRAYCKDGEIRILEVLGTRIELGGQPMIMGTALDITERIQYEDELRRGNLYHRNLLEVSPDALVTIGLDGKIMDVNRATEQATGYSREQLIGTEFASYFTEPDLAREGYQQAFRKGLVRNYELKLHHRDGRVTSVIYNASIYHDESGGIAGVFAAARDITERKHSEDLLRRLTAKLYRVQHEERRRIAIELHDSVAQTLTAVRIKLGILHRTIGDDVATQLEAVTELVLSAITDIRSIVSELSPVELYELGLHDALELAAEQIGQRYGISVLLQAPSSDIDLLNEDRRIFLLQAIRELLRNAGKHAACKNVAINIRREGRIITVSVTDDGTGFIQLPESFSESQESGFGLPSIREGLRRYGASLLDISSVMPQGTKVTFKLKLDSAE